MSWVRIPSPAPKNKYLMLEDTILETKNYNVDFEPIDLGFKVHQWIKIDLEKLRAWHSDLESNYSDWKFYVDDSPFYWKKPLVTFKHILPPETYYYNLCWNGNIEGALPFARANIKDEYKDPDSNELNPRKCFDGYALEIVKSLPIKSKRWLISAHAPGTRLRVHQDRGNKVRIHIPIYSDTNSKFIIDGESHYLEPGWIYLVNTTFPHTVYNLSNTNRIHLYGKIWMDEIKGLNLC